MSLRKILFLVVCVILLLLSNSIIRNTFLKNELTPIYDNISINKYFERYEGVRTYVSQNDKIIKNINITAGLYKRDLECNDAKIVIFNSAALYQINDIKNNIMVDNIENGNRIILKNSYGANISDISLKDNGYYSIGIKCGNYHIIESTYGRLYKYRKKIYNVSYEINNNEIDALFKNIVPDKYAEILYLDAELKEFGNHYFLQGNLYVKNIESARSNLIIEVEDDTGEKKYFKTFLNASAWTRKQYGNSALLTGFNASILELNHNSEYFNIKFYIYNDDKLYSSRKTYVYELINETYKRIDDDKQANTSRPMKKSKKFNTVINKEIVNKDLGIDKEQDKYLFRGVSFIQNSDSKDYQIFVEIKNDKHEGLYRVEHKYSDWAARNYGKQYAYSHILLPLSKEQLSDNGTIKLYLKNGDNYYTTGREHIYSFENDKYLINKIYDSKINEKYIGIDKNNDNTFTFRGAIYKENEESSNYNIIVEVKNENGDIKYNIPKTYSKYMADMLGEKYAYSHILLQLSKEQLGDNGVIKLYLKNGDNYYTTGREYTYSLKNNEYSIK